MASAREASHEHPARVLGVILGDARGAPHGPRPGRHRRRLDRRDRPDPAARRGGQARRVGRAAAAAARLPGRDLVGHQRTAGPRRRPARRPGPAADHRRRGRHAGQAAGHAHAVLVVLPRQHRPGLDAADALAGAAGRGAGPVPDRGHVGVGHRRADQPERGPARDLARRPAQGEGRAGTAPKGPGITEMVLETKQGPIRISRGDGKLATISSPERPDRPIALKRLGVPALLAEELRRLDEDDVYAACGPLVREEAAVVTEVPPRPAPRIEVHVDAADLATSVGGRADHPARGRPGPWRGAADRAHRRLHRRRPCTRSSGAWVRAPRSTGRGWSSGGATSGSWPPTPRTATPGQARELFLDRLAVRPGQGARDPLDGRRGIASTRRPRRTPQSSASTAPARSRC